MPSRRIEVPDIRQHQLAGPTIAIVAGGGGKSYNVHERILRNASPFFETALAGPWTESQTRQINLPADDSTAVGIYVSWLYFSAIPVVCGSSSEYLDLARAYVFADKILDGRFHNAIIDALVEKSTNQGADHKRSCPQASVINYVYKYTAEGAPIRKLLEDICARYGQPSLLKNGMNLPLAFALGVAASSLAWRLNNNHETKLNLKTYYNMD